MKTIIMAGGKGTRIASVASDIPKPMIPIHGKPILEYQLECLRQNGLTDIIIGIGHLGQVIQDYFGDGAKFGCHITYYAETTPLGTAGALYKITADPEYALSNDFILLHGDTIFDLDFSRFIAFHREKHALVSLVAHPNSHPFDSALLVTDAEHRVIQWLNKEDPRQYYRNQVNAGLHILSKTLFTGTQPGREKVDLDRDILKPLIAGGNTVSRNAVYAYNTPEYIKDMGTPDRYAQVAADIKNGLVKQRNLSHKQRAVFLDRDGTINTFKGFITKPEQLELIDGAAAAIRAINEAGFLAIVITNQPIIARGEATFEELRLIHDKLETELGKAGAYIDDLFFCPHHPDKSFAGERPEYKIDCNCRKPKPGLILVAARKYNIDLSQSYMVGDDMRDVEAGCAAGCKAILLTDKAGTDVPAFSSLAAFVNGEICGEKRAPAAIDEDIRWKQRFANYKKALVNLTKTVEWAKTHDEHDIVNLSIIKAFELSFELSWNVMKDYLTNMGINGIIGSKGAIRHAFQNGLIDNGQTWLDMIDDRNEATHTYDLEIAGLLTEKIIHNHYPQFLAFAEKMESMN